MGWLPQAHLRSLRTFGLHALPVRSPRAFGLHKPRFHRAGADSDGADCGDAGSIALDEMLHSVLQHILVVAEQELMMIFRKREGELLKEIATLKQQQAALLAENSHLTETLSARSSGSPECRAGGNAADPTDTPAGAGAPPGSCKGAGGKEDEASDSAQDIESTSSFPRPGTIADTKISIPEMDEDDRDNEDFEPGFRCYGVVKQEEGDRDSSAPSSSNSSTSSSSNYDPDFPSFTTRRRLNRSTLSAVVHCAEQVVPPPPPRSNCGSPAESLEPDCMTV